MACARSSSQEPAGTRCKLAINSGHRMPTRRHRRCGRAEEPRLAPTHLSVGPEPHEARPGGWPQAHKAPAAASALSLASRDLRLLRATPGRGGSGSGAASAGRRKKRRGRPSPNAPLVRPSRCPVLHHPAQGVSPPRPLPEGSKRRHVLLLPTRPVREGGWGRAAGVGARVSRGQPGSAGVTQGRPGSQRGTGEERESTQFKFKHRGLGMSQALF